ncbi:MAG: pilus assembly protein N-terminal domain-containing protein [Planctomycetaceae bacterium]
MMRFTRPWTITAGLAVGVLLASAASTPLHAQPAPAPDAVSLPDETALRVAAPTESLSVIQLQSRVVETEARIRLVDDFDPKIVTVTAISPTQLRVRGEMPGVTTVRVADEFDHVYRVEVIVEKDLRELEVNLRRLFPGSAIKVVGVKDDIVLQGWVTEPSQIPQIVEVTATYAPKVQNHLQVGGGNQVQLSCKVLEVQRSKLEQMGFNFLLMGQKYYLASTPGNLAPIATADAPFGGPPVVSTAAAALTNSTAQFAVLGSSDVFRGFIEALKTESLLKIVAEPTLITTGGRPAEFHSGGEFPILVPQGVGTASIQFRPFGVRLETVPIVLGNGRVQLDIGAEISERDFSNSVTSGSLVVPGLTSRNVNTRVEMNFGETVMLGGLTQDRVISNTQKVPVLGDIPYLGVAFSRKRNELATTELIILVTPHLITPMGPGQVPCNGPGFNSDQPTSHEIFLDGHMEVPRFSQHGNACPPGLMGPGGCSPNGPAMSSGYGTPYEAGGMETFAPTQVPSPSYDYAPAMPTEGILPGQPLYPSGEGLPPMLPPVNMPPAGATPVAPTSWPAASAQRGDFRSAGPIRPVGATTADIAPPVSGRFAGSPGLIEPGRAPVRTAPPGRPAPQYIGSSGLPR